MGFYVPKTLQRGKRWVVWRYEEVGSKRVKKPYSAYYDGGANVTNPKTWAYYSQAAQKLKYGDFSGLGYVFAAEDGLTFIDLDHCIDETGEFTDFAREIIDLFPRTYTEYSISETGLHLVVKGRLPAAYKDEKIELYSEGRYMAFTGNVVEALEPQPAQRALDVLIERYKIAQRPQELASVERTEAAYNDDNILQRAARGGNGATFAALWAGNWESLYSSQSEADLRMISIIYYYSRNREQTKRIFLSSGLGKRDKAKRADYLDRLIEKVSQSMAEQQARKAAQKPPRSQQERSQGAGGTNTLRDERNGATWRAGGYKRQGLTDQPDNRNKRAFRK